MQQCKVSTRVYVEAIDLETGQGLGYLQELPLFKGASTSVSASLQKSASIELYNPLELLSRSKRADSPRGVRLESDIEYLRAYTQKLMDIYGARMAPLNPQQFVDYVSGKGPESWVDKDYAYGVDGIPQSTAAIHELGSNIGLLQRVWIVTTSDWGASGEQEVRRRHSVFAGIITSIQENYASQGSGDTSLSLSVSGLSRLMEMVFIYEHRRLAAYTGTVLEERSKTLNNELFGLAGYKTEFDILSNLNASSFAALPAYLTNYFMTAVGYLAGENKANFYRQWDSGNTWRNFAKKEAFFYVEPIWDFPNNTTWQQILKGTSETVKELGAASEKALSILSGETDGVVLVSEMLPRVWVDPLLIHIWNNSPALSITENKIQQEWSITNTSNKSAKDIFLQAGVLMFANAYEDDFGNLRLEVPRYWVMPRFGDSAYESYCNISEYRDDIRSSGVPLGDDTVTADYIIPDDFVSSFGKTTSESNVVTHVEVPTNFALEIRPDEYVVSKTMTGRVEAGDPDILKLQQRFGLRIESVPPLWLNKANAGSTGDDANDNYRKNLSSFAKAILELRNMSMTSMSLTLYPPLHWLEVNKPLLLMCEEALFLIVQKTVSYSVDGEPSMMLTLSVRHRINERVGYPFYDFIKPYLATGAAAAPAAAQVPLPYPSSGVVSAGGS